MYNILIFSTLVLSAFAAPSPKEGPCPDVKPVENFDITAFTQGKWYEIARYPNLFEERADCVSFQFEKDDEFYQFHVTDIIDHSNKYFDGYMSLAPNANGTGALNFYPTKNKDGLSILAYVVDTDNVNYQISFQCLYNETNKKRTEFAWIGSRTKVLPEAAKAAVNKFLENNSFIDTKQLIYNHFTEDSCSIKA